MRMPFVGDSLEVDGIRAAIPAGSRREPEAPVAARLDGVCIADAARSASLPFLGPLGAPFGIRHELMTKPRFCAGDAGPSLAAVAIVPSLQDPEALKQKFPKGYTAVTPYLRLTPQPNLG